MAPTELRDATCELGGCSDREPAVARVVAEVEELSAMNLIAKLVAYLEEAEHGIAIAKSTLGFFTAACCVHLDGCGGTNTEALQTNPAEFESSARRAVGAPAGLESRLYIADYVERRIDIYDRRDPSRGVIDRITKGVAYLRNLCRSPWAALRG